MVAEFLNRDVVLDQLSELKEFVGLERERDRQASRPTTEHDVVLKELNAADLRERAKSSGQPSFDAPGDDRRGVGPAPIDDFAFVSRDPIIGLLQSSLDELYDKPEMADKVVERPPSDDRRGDFPPLVSDRSLREAPEPRRSGDRRIFDKFSITDIGWVRSKIAEGIRLFRGKHAFNVQPAKPVEFANGTRLVVVGDWGTGLPRAREVAKQMRQKVNEGLARGAAVHVIHLGDVYYSGWGHEYRKRFLPYWPVRPEEADRVGSWCLNGNHDMYSGGHGYHEVALADSRFSRWQSDGTRPSSFFSLVNPDWKILGLDTSWDDAGLKDPQATWLQDELRTAGSRKTLLLSHHQLFSAYEEGARELAEKIQPVLDAHPIDAWFWGHEHRCMWFEAHKHVSFGRCLGDGGMPVYQWHESNEQYPPPGTYEHRRFIPSGLERWAVMGFAVLDFDGARIHAHYVDETGYEHHDEKIE